MDKNYRPFSGARSFGEYLKERGLPLNSSSEEIYKKFNLGNSFGQTSQVKDQTAYQTIDKILENISKEGSGSGIPIEKSLVLPINTTQTPQSILPTPPTPTETTPPVNPLPTPQPTLGQAMNTTPTATPAVTAPATPDVYELASGGINNRNLGLVGGIIDAKNLYASAPEGTAGDAQRKQAHDYAENIRKIAEMRQIPLGQFGEGNLTTEQANLALGNYLLDQQEQAQNQFLNVQKNLSDNYGESSNDHFWRLYDEYRQQGKGDRDATILAGRKTMAYQQARKDKLIDAINEYGIENGNTLNQFGMNMLAQVAEEDNIMGTVYANGFANPRINYEKQQAALMETLKQNAADRRKAQEIAAQKANIQYQVEHQDLRTAANLASKESEGQRNRENSYNIATLKEDRTDARTDKVEAGKDRRAKEKIEADKILAEIRASKKNSNKAKTQQELEKEYAEIAAKYRKYAEEFPDEDNIWEDTLYEAEDAKYHRFEGNLQTQEGTWSWATDISDKFARQYGRRPTWEEFSTLMRSVCSSSPHVEGVLNNIFAQKNPYILWEGENTQ